MHSFRKSTAENLLLAAISFGFYIFFYIYDGAVVCADSHSYIYMEYFREPVYPAYLALFRALFSWVDLPGHIRYVNAEVLDDTNLFYLDMAVLEQCLIAAACALALVLYIRKTLKLRLRDALVMLFFCLAVSLMCRFAAKRASMYSSSIMTEGIACSLFLLFIRFLYQYIRENRMSALVISGVLSCVLINTRKQMYITLALLALAIIYREIFARAASEHISRLRTVLKTFLMIFVCAALVMAAGKAFEKAYSYCLYGTNFTHSQDNRFVTTMVFYTVDREDGERIEDPDIRALFYEIYDVCDEEGDLMHSAPEGIYASVSHFGDHYDMIQLDHMQAMIEDYAEQHNTGNLLDEQNMIDDINSQIIKALLPVTWKKILYVFALNCVEGLCNTAAKFSPRFMPFAAFIWAAYIVLLILGIKKNGMNAVNELAVLTLVSSLINIALVALVIFCQTRYIIYNMPLFYISLYLMLRELFSRSDS